MKSLRIFFLGLTVVAALGFAWFKFRPPEVVVGKPFRGDAIAAAYATGSVEPVLLIQVSPRVTARLSALHVDEGNLVSEGQVLATLESEDLKAAVQAATAREARAKAEYERLRAMKDSGAMSAQQRDNARYQAEASLAERTQAEAQLKYLALTAPQAGRVIKRDHEVGETIGAKDIVFSLAAGTDLRVTAEVDEEEAARVVVGQEVLLKADALPGEVLRGTVASITPKGDPVARSFRVRISIPEGQKLLIGMTVETNIIFERHAEALLIPTTAIEKVVEKEVVWIVEGNRLALRTVKVGIRGDKNTEVLSGLSGDESVVTSYSPTYTPGMKVRVKGQPQDQ